MKKSKQKKQIKKGRATMAVTGAIIGVGAAVAGALFMKDKKNRDKFKKVISNTKNKAVGYAKKIEKKVTAKKTPTKKNKN